MATKAPDDTCLPARLPQRASRFRLGVDEYVVFSMPDAPSLSPAEAEVARLIVAGHTNAEIAVIRGTAVRTVANQVAGVLRKLGVDGRSELAALFAIAPSACGYTHGSSRAC